ncbi:DUF2088 domain-containing protein [Clostridium luticellarii]|jgi:hypothetical protein|uniref:DUF2088 domain-containing protein n=1 Tax=Clostridium luticellarii TaxID=1691940 RepID=UPI0023538D0E|nr:DUF2088 domain-containing protein [Clostridium luticellarii]MCI1945815.1 DUF2088 domain-containing protein [Clostridium luticellarii]MCI1968959.1 DUF2088 domain-containing protein [Clostridium luticellarii]MCI1996286.1 DUF2088 domain-containing protein [Clostridium luticellarii]MCI2040310.1 DUF2088 domain-containing protein [Clostridium luticellarii]
MLDIKMPVIHKIVTEESCSCLSEKEIIEIVQHGIDRELEGKDIKGKKIGVLAGSRGIRDVQLIIKQVIINLKAHGADVIVLPAMGSHGGATAAGQRSILDHYGINEKELGVPIVSNMEVETIDHIGRQPVYVDKKVLDLDYIVPVNRVKAHTDFHGEHESGVIKMLVIGIGKQAQAEAVHQHGANGLKNLIPKVAEKVLEHIPLLAAVAIVENKRDMTAAVEVLNAGNIFEKDAELLKYSKKLLPKLPLSNLDVLVIKEMGKNISGVGMDPNVIGRMRINGIPDDPGTASRIVILDLTEESEGNALGMGIADVTTKRLYDKVDIQKTYMNTITSGFLERCFIPVVAPTDKEAIRIALQTCGRAVDQDTARIMLIDSTLELSHIYISSALLPEVPPEYKICGTDVTDVFDGNGNLTLF